MNKETRIFIWGLILLFIGSIGLAINIDKITHYYVSVSTIIYLVANIVCIVIGSMNIYKTMR